MNYIDIVILLFLLYGAFRGFSKGLIIEVATLAGLILGVFIAIRYSPFTEGILKDFLNITSLPVGCDCSLFAGEDVDQTGRYYFVGVGQ